MSTPAAGYIPPLVVSNAVKRFGGLYAVNDVSFEAQSEHIVGIIGPNGSGKSTLCNLITGVVPATSGRVTLGTENITRYRPDRIFRLGLSRTFQNTRLFSAMTVHENMTIAARGRGLSSKVAAEHLERLQLGHLRQSPAASLSYGDQKLVELGMSLIGDAHTVILDEPLAGVHTSVVDEIRKDILERSSETRFVIVEHNVGFMLEVCERIIVMDRGSVIADGTPRTVRDDPAVIAAYFGSSEDVPTGDEHEQ